MINSSKFIVHSSSTKSIAKLLKRKLPASIFKVIRKVGELAKAQGYSAYIVGGFVRDLLLGVENLDVDIVVGGDAISLAKLLQKQVNATLRTHPRFGTATLTFSDGFKIDLVTARREKYIYPATLPRVTFSSIEDDLWRRDFTINTLALAIGKGNFGQLLDLFSGIEDLKKKKIRILHKRSFIDDPTRIFRAIRFEQRFNFKIEPETFNLMRKAHSLKLLEKLSRFRLGREFILLLKEERPQKALLRFDKLCGLEIVHTMIKLDKKTQAKVKSLKTNDWMAYFALLTRKLSQNELSLLCRDFSLTKRDKKRLKTLRLAF